jgi:hypothetical protein
MQEPSKTENSKKRKVNMRLVGGLFLLIIFAIALDVRGSFTLLMIPIPVGAEEDTLFFGGIDSRGAFRDFVVYRNYIEIKDFYETELSQQQWAVETKSSTFSNGNMVCLKIAKSPFFNAFVEIYGNPNSNRTKVNIMPPARYSTCQNDFD